MNFPIVHNKPELRNEILTRKTEVNVAGEVGARVGTVKTFFIKEEHFSLSNSDLIKATGY